MQFRASAIRKRLAEDRPLVLSIRIGSERQRESVIDRWQEALSDVIELHEPIEFSDGFRICSTCGSGEPHEYPVEWPCQTLLRIAKAIGVETT